MDPKAAAIAAWMAAQAGGGEKMDRNPVAAALATDETVI